MANTRKKFLPDNVIELLFGLGASIVIIGALMKITHYNPDIISSNTMLSIGLIAEAIIFAIAGIQGYMAGDSSVEDKGLQTIEAETQSLQQAVDQTVSGLSSLNKNYLLTRLFILSKAFVNFSKNFAFLSSCKACIFKPFGV